MHPNPRRVAPVVLAVLALSALAYWYFSVRPAQAGGADLRASGTIEIAQVQIAPELGGRVVEVRAAEGDPVRAGDVLVQLDAALLQAQRAQAAAALEAAGANAEAAQYNSAAAQSAVDAAQASLDLLEAGASPEQLAAAQAQVAQAEAGYQAAQASFAALTAGARPEDVAAARQRLDLARRAYDGMVMALSVEQVTDVNAALYTAQANREQAQTRLDHLKADNAMPLVALDAAEIALADAQTANRAAQAAADAVAADADSAVPFYRQIEAARRARDQAELNLSQARARQALLQRTDDLPQAALDAAQDDVDAAQTFADDARAAYDSLNSSAQADRLRAAWTEAQNALNDLNRLGRNPATPVEMALNQLDASAALSDLAGANLSATQSGARSEQISGAQAQLDAAAARNSAAQAQAAAAQAQVGMAQAALDILDVQIAKLTLTAPADGVVLTRIIQPGEFAAPGSTMLVLGQTADKTITVFISEEVYGMLSIGQQALVSVDSFPGQTFSAEVVHIADKAEFTPRNVQTAQGRKNTVFAIKLRLVDPEDRLKAGMPADVVFK